MDKVLASQEAELVCLEPMSKVPRLSNNPRIEREGTEIPGQTG